MLEFGIYSAGDEYGNAEKRKMIIDGICSALFLALYIITFISAVDLTNGITISIDTILLSLLILITTWWIPLLNIVSISESRRYLKNNKLICLYFYNLEEFMKMQKIPKDRFIILLSKNGAVLAENKWEEESCRICSKYDTYEQLKAYCNKHAVCIKVNN